MMSLSRKWFQTSHWVLSVADSDYNSYFNVCLTILMRRALSILREPFPYYLNDDRKNTWWIAGLSLFVIVFLIVLLPKEWIWIAKFSLIGVVIFTVLYPAIVWAPKWFPKLINPDTWTIGKYIGYTILQLMAIGITCSALTYAFNFHPEMTFWMNMKYFFIDMMMYGTISVVLFTFVLRNIMLKNSLRQALHANAELDKLKVLPARQESSGISQHVVLQSDTSEIAEFQIDKFLFAEANDNYSTVYWEVENGVEKKMLRVNMKSVESQLNSPTVVRCHRSFLVNTAMITAVEGNTNGYKLSIRGTDMTVPVSRGKGREVIGKIEEMRNQAELA